MPLTPTRRLFTVDEYDRMGEAGILTTDDRVELIEGEIVHKPVISPYHALVVTRAQRLFERALGDRAIVRVQNPVWLTDLAVPEPDLALLRPREDEYGRSHPRAPDILLLVEVADSSLLSDRARKVPLYGTSGVEELWLANLVSDVFEVHRSPTPGGYSELIVVERGKTLSPLAFPDVAVDVSDLLA